VDKKTATDNLAYYDVPTQSATQTPAPGLTGGLRQDGLQPNVAAALGVPVAMKPADDDDATIDCPVASVSWLFPAVSE